jgi:streptogramin lyase
MLQSIAFLAALISEYALPSGVGLPHRIAKGPDGNMWFTEQTGQHIGRIGMTGTIVEFALPAGSNPMGIAAGADGNMWFTQALRHRIGRIDPAGKIVEFTDGMTAGSTPGEITAGPDGALWFGEDVPENDGSTGTKIGRIVPAGTIAEFALPPGSGSVNGIASDATHIWFTLGFPRNAIGSMDVHTHHIEIFPLPDGISFAEGIAAGPDGNVWFTMPLDHQIGRITADGKITAFAMPDRADRTGGPANITLGPDGAMWFTDFNQSRIGRVTTTGAIEEFAGVTEGSSPDGIALGPDGNIWFTEYNGGRIGKLVVGAGK